MSRVNEMHESSEQQCPKDQNRRNKRCHVLSGDIVVRFQNTRDKALISLRKKEKADDFFLIKIKHYGGWGEGVLP